MSGIYNPIFFYPVSILIIFGDKFKQFLNRRKGYEKDIYNDAYSSLHGFMSGQ